MCKDHTKNVLVIILADLSSTGKEKYRECKIDACIATLVDALQKADINMRGSCCGHEGGEGDIHLQDGRALLILDKETADVYYRKKERGEGVRGYIRGWEARGKDINERIKKRWNVCAKCGSEDPLICIACTRI